MKSKFTAILLACAFASAARADFNPVALTPGSYTYDIVVESNTAPPLPYCINVTAGAGTSEGDNTYYEQGLYARAGQSGGNSGVPIHNTVFADINNANITFLMPPTYLTNNDLMIDSTFTTGTLVFDAPTTATNLAILGADGNGSMSVSYTVTHSDNSTESGTISMADWFNGGATVAWGANGRITSGGGYNNFNSSSVNNNAPYLYANKITVSGAVPIVSVTFTYVSSGAHANFLAVSGNAAGSAWTPIPVGGFNVMAIVPAAFPLTATMDQGTNTANNGNLATWYEQGFDPSAPSTGLPPSGSTFNSQSQPTHHYQMGNYSTNNAVLVDSAHLVANITPSNPAPYSAFALLTAGGNIGGGNVMTNICILQHADGVNETNLFYGYDWFNSSVAAAYVANGRVNMYSRTDNNVNNNFPRLFESYFTLNDVGSPVTNIVVEYATSPSGNSTTYVMAVSASSGGVPVVVNAGALPATQTWFPTQTATFSVSVSGTAPITNEWLEQTGVDLNSNAVYTVVTNGVDANGSTIYGATTTSLVISNLSLADGTNFIYIGANAFGSATSSPALLIMNPNAPLAPYLDSQSPNASFSVLTNHANTTTFSVTVDTNSAPPVFYQWYNGAAGIPGATGSSFVNSDTNNASIYCVVTNFVGAVTSSPVNISVILRPALTPYQSAIFAYQPVAYWPLTETSGNIAFDYAGTNDGIYTGNYSLGNPGLPETDGIGTNSSAGFDGSTAYVDVQPGNMNITGPMTVIQWVQTTYGGDTGFATSIGHSDSSWRLDVAGGQGHWADSGPDIVSPLMINDANWHQLVGVYDGTNQYLYVDGQPSGAPHSGSPGAGNSGSHVRIAGAPDYGNRFFAGNIAQVAVLSNALTAAQVAAIYGALDTPPNVTVTPANPSIYAGENVTLTAVLSGTPATSLQWYFIDTSGNSNNIAGATSSTYTVVNVPVTQNGYTYGVIAANAYGTNTATTVLVVQNGPAYLGGDIAPLNGEAYAGAPVIYTINAQGTAPIFYQWLVDGVPLAGATNASLTLPAPCGAHTIQASFTNAQNGGSAVLSSVANLQGDTEPTNITFLDDPAALQLQGTGGGVPTFQNNVLELTDGNGNEASSAFFNVAQYVGNFTASFVYTGNGAADGVAFVVQNSPLGAAALGGGGGGLGYSGITNSLALELNLYSDPGMVQATNGNTGGFNPTGPVDITTGDPIQVNLNYLNGYLAVSLEDMTTFAEFATNYAVGSLTTLLGGTDLGYVGFTGGDGGLASIQTIGNFEFHSVIAPVSLSVSRVTGNSFTISWPAADPNYVLQVSPSLTSPSWTTGPAPVTVNGVNNVSVSATGGGSTLFYRLVHVACNE